MMSPVGIHSDLKHISSKSHINFASYHSRQTQQIGLGLGT